MTFRSTYVVVVVDDVDLSDARTFLLAVIARMVAVVLKSGLSHDAVYWYDLSVFRSLRNIEEADHCLCYFGARG